MVTAVKDAVVDMDLLPKVKVTGEKTYEILRYTGEKLYEKGNEFYVILY
jgi:hypothetical protein